MSLATLCLHTILFVYIVVNVCKQLLISGGGQLLGNEDVVKISLRSALPVGNSYKSFQCMVHDIQIFKENCYLFCIFLF